MKDLNEIQKILEEPKGWLKISPDDIMHLNDCCKNLNRQFIGIEMQEDYFNIASERVGKKRKEKEIEAPTLFNELN